MDATCKAIRDMHQRHHGNEKGEWIRNQLKRKMTTHRLSKHQSLSTTTVLFRTTFTRTIKLNLLLKWLLGSNLSQFNLTGFTNKIIKVDCKSFKSFTANYTKSKQLKIKYFNNFVLNSQYNTHERKQTPSQDTEIIITSNITMPFQKICICIQGLY